MRGTWDHIEPNVTQEEPEDNTSQFVKSQIAVWQATGTLIHPEAAMEIAAWYHGPRWPGLTAFSHTGKITDTLIDELENDLRASLPRDNTAEIEAVIAYVRAVKGEDPVAEELIKVVWNPRQRRWSVGARASSQSLWNIFEGAEDQLDELLSIARDCATGG